MTTVVKDFENLDGRGHGAKIETCAMIPDLFLPLLPWRDGTEFKMLAAKYRHMDGLLALCRDRDTGRVYPDPGDGRCRIDYRVSPFDRSSLVKALIGMAKIAYVSGATEFHPAYGDMPPFIRQPPSTNGTTTTRNDSISVNDDEPETLNEGVNNAALQAWIKEFRRKAPLNPEKALFVSAHQMGTCRMGTSPKQSVIDPDGQVWGVKGLYIADASVFPSASGVNPMVTNMAISDWTSRKIATAMNQEKSSRTV
jgi:GMC oxidoreductase